jgi:CheY-like chemotaxis protein
MHPLLQHWRRSLLYLAAWLEFGLILGFIAASSGHVARLAGIALALPMAMLLALVCLAPYYVCRSVPLRAVAWRKLVQHHLIDTVVASAAVMLAGRLVASLLSPVWPGLDTLLATATPILTVFVALSYLFSIALHYIFHEIESSRRAELLAREAQLKALKAQINPHFLFNSLNSISALTTIDPARPARCASAGRFSAHLAAPGRARHRSVCRRDWRSPRCISMWSRRASANALRMKSGYRSGLRRLRYARAADSAAGRKRRQARHRHDGGRRRDRHLRARAIATWLRFSITNPFDPEAPVDRAATVWGCATSATRLESRYGGAAYGDAVEDRTRLYSVTLTFPGQNSMKYAPSWRTTRNWRGAFARISRGRIRYRNRGGVPEWLRSRQGGERSSKPDILFLDVQMPKLDGFEVIELVDSDGAVVFVTAYDQYAMRPSMRPRSIIC